MTEPILKSGAIILKDKKLLIVRKQNTSIYILPGGKKEKNESFDAALIRELDEELRITPLVFGYFELYTSGKAEFEDKPLMLKTYMIDVTDGNPVPSSEIEEMQWLNKEGYQNTKYTLASLLQEKIIPDLIKKGRM